jgi:peptide deformylase
MDILVLGNDGLRQKAAPVKHIDGNLVKTAENMLELTRQGRGVGLAGPQVGLMSRLFVTQIDKDIPRVFINPSILETSPETGKYEEGCLSLPGVWADVIRPLVIRIQAWNEKGRPFTLDADRILARVILHEYDHLDGVLFIDRLSELKRSRLLAKYEKLRKNGGK